MLGSSWFGAATTMTVGDDDQPTGVSDADWDEWSGTFWGLSMGAGVSSSSRRLLNACFICYENC